MPARARQAVGGARPVEFFSGLRQARLLAAYIGLGLAATLYLAAAGYGSRFLVALLANLAFLALYVAVVNFTTRAAPPRPGPVSHPRLETAILLAYAVFLIARSTDQITWFDITGLIPAYREVDGLVVGTTRALVESVWAGAPAILYRIVSNVFWMVGIPLGVFTLLGYHPSALGLSVQRWWVAIPLIALTALPPLAGAGLGSDALGLAAGFAGNLLAVGITHEFFYRGLLLSRLEACGVHGLDALAISSVVFALAQAPVLLNHYGLDLVLVVALLFASAGAPAGLGYGYVYLRTRGIAPGALWHASPWAAFPFN